MICCDGTPARDHQRCWIETRPCALCEALDCLKQAMALNANLTAHLDQFEGDLARLKFRLMEEAQ